MKIKISLFNFILFCSLLWGQNDSEFKFKYITGKNRGYVNVKKEIIFSDSCISNNGVWLYEKSHYIEIANGVDTPTKKQNLLVGLIDSNKNVIVSHHFEKIIGFPNNLFLGCLPGECSSFYDGKLYSTHDSIPVFNKNLKVIRYYKDAILFRNYDDKNYCILSIGKKLEIDSTGLLKFGIDKRQRLEIVKNINESELLQSTRFMKLEEINVQEINRFDSILLRQPKPQKPLWSFDYDNDEKKN